MITNVCFRQGTYRRILSLLNNELQWSKEELHSFHSLKEVLTAASAMDVPIATDPFNLNAEASISTCCLAIHNPFTSQGIINTSLDLGDMTEENVA
ncbi:hypothetical protein PoB_006553100 [Plakobranchus ocellatus]|uniref:Uncharacterized protein n=1 Tax=Plakobranchus ocellatus TaxID=259542 RepID=A0AAV4D4C7_9GAST|nr:hypothetical protein PoB_006553100 [Plakobranchus ocellatus]